MSTLIRADSLREYLTGASSAGEAQPDPLLSLGDYRSSDEVVLMNMNISNPIKNVRINHVAGANPSGVGYLIAFDELSLRWRAPDAAIPGPVVSFVPGVQTTQVLEGDNTSQFIRVTATAPFDVGTSPIKLTPMMDGVFSFSWVSDAQAASGISQYRATILKNVSSASVFSIKRFLKELAPSRVSNVSALGGSGSGTIQSSQPFDEWPKAGWCRIEESNGTLREVVYYSSRTDYTLQVASSGRGLLDTAAGAGAATDVLKSIPGVAIGIDPNGVQASGSSIQLIPDDTTEPASVTWSTGTTPTSGLSIATLGPGEEVGIWTWRQLPAGAVFDANVSVVMKTNFLAF